jgi:hypothetical protein
MTSGFISQFDFKRLSAKVSTIFFFFFFLVASEDSQRQQIGTSLAEVQSALLSESFQSVLNEAAALL